MKFHLYAIFMAAMACLFLSATATPIEATRLVAKEEDKKIAFCKAEMKSGFHRFTIQSYYPEEKDVGAICGKLWDKLNDFGGCYTIVKPSCDYREGKYLRWRFQASIFCYTADVKKAWQKATFNEYGEANCEA